MEAVQAQVLSHYRSELVERIRANGDVLSADGSDGQAGEGIRLLLRRRTRDRSGLRGAQSLFRRRSPFICSAKSFTTPR